MSDYIDRNELIKHIKDLPTWWGDDSVGCAFYLTRAITSIENAPAADVQEIKHGEWIEMYNNPDDGNYYCSECRNFIDIAIGRETPIDRDFFYCPHCGAKMDGKEVEGE